jgi:hypothetical protein
LIRLDIKNDGTGTEEVGNYTVHLFLPTGRRIVPWRWCRARVEGHVRSEGWHALVLKAADALKEKVDQ